MILVLLIATAVASAPSFGEGAIGSTELWRGYVGPEPPQPQPEGGKVQAVLESYLSLREAARAQASGSVPIGSHAREQKAWVHRVEPQPLGDMELYWVSGCDITGHSFYDGELLALHHGRARALVPVRAEPEGAGPAPIRGLVLRRVEDQGARPDQPSEYDLDLLAGVRQRIRGACATGDSATLTHIGGLWALLANDGAWARPVVEPSDIDHGSLREIVGSQAQGQVTVPYAAGARWIAEDEPQLPATELHTGEQGCSGTATYEVRRTLAPWLTTVRWSLEGDDLTVETTHLAYVSVPIR